MATLTEIAASLKIDTKQFKKELGQAQKGLNTFTKGIGQVNKAMGMLAVGGIAAVTAGLVNLAKSSVQTGMAFEKSLKTLGAIKGFTDLSDATSEASISMEKLERTARELGKSTAYSATQASDAMIELGRAGLTASEISSAIAPSLYLAGASASDLTSATALMSATIKQFSLDSSEATRISDVFTIAQQETMLSMESLTNAMRFAGTVGSAMGMSLEETTAAVGMFRDLGVQGATAGTQFRQMMISLANPTAKAQKTLEKFGLTVDDVNPQIKGFRGVIETLAKSNMDLADITTLVSKRASGSVTKLVEQFKLAQNSIDGTTFKYDDLIRSFEEGGGTAEATYQSMIDTVAGRFDILKSAFEEFQLTIFDTFAEPLKEVIGEDDGSGLIGLVNTFTETFQASSLVFQQMFGEMFGQTLRNINKNQTEIATGFISIITQAVRLGKTIVSLVPYFVTLFKVSVAWIVTAKVVAFAQAIQTMIVGLQGATTAMGGLRIAMTALITTSGGIFPLIAGFTALVAVVSTFAFMSAKATAEQERVTKSINASRQALQDFNDTMVDSQRGRGTGAIAKTGIEKTNILNEIEAELEARGELTSEIERGFATLDKMTEAQENQAFAQGKLFSVMIDGNRVVLDHTQALRLASTSLGEQEDIYGQLAKQTENLNKETNKLGKSYRRDLAAYQKVKDVVSGLEDGTITYEESLRQTRRAMMDFSVPVKDLFVDGQNVNTVLSDMTFHLAGVEAGFVASSKATDQFNELLAQSEAKLLKEREKARKKAEEKEAQERQERISKFREDYKKANEARLELEEKLQRQLDVLRAGETEKVAVELQQRLKDTRKIYDEEIKLVGSNTRKKLQIESEYLETVKKLTEQATKSQLDSLIQTTSEFEKQNTQFGESQISSFNRIANERIEQEKKTLQSILNANKVSFKNQRYLLEDQFTDRLISEEKFIAEYNKIETQRKDADKKATEEFEKAKGEIRKNTELKTGQVLEGITQQITQNRIALAKTGVLQELEQRQIAARQELVNRKATNDQLESLDKLHREQRIQAEAEIIDQFVKPYGQYTEEIDKLNSRLSGKLLDRSRERLEKEREYLEEKFRLEQKLGSVELATQGLDDESRASAIQRVQDELDQLDKDFEQKGKSFGSSLINGFKKAAETIKKLFGNVFNFIGSSIQAISQQLSSGLSFFTGGAITTDIGGLLSQAAQNRMDVSSEQKEQRESLQASLASGDITKEQYDREISRLDEQIDPSAIAQDFIDNLVDNAKNFAMSIAEQAPLIINGLAVAIPQLIEQLVESIPQVIIALGKGIPQVVLSLVDGIIELLPVLADALINNALPNIVNGLVTLLTEKIPQLADTLLPIVQDLVQFILEAAPKITNAIVGALPSVIDFLVQGITEILTGIPQLLKTLLSAIPIIITELLGGVSELVRVIFSAIPLIINEIILALPSIINALLKGLLGVLVEIAKSLPDLIGSIINLLPVLLTAILELIPEIIIALVEALPLILEGLIELIPVLIESLITLIPDLIFAIINALPVLVAVLVGSIFELIFKNIPRLVFLLVEGIIKGIGGAIGGIIESFENFFNTFPQKLREAFEFLSEIPQRIGDSLREAFEGFKDFFGDVITEITSLGKKETATFGDTPSAIQAGSSGLTANFAANDYIIAAQRPMELLRQAMEAVGSNLPNSLTTSVAKAFPPQQNTSSSSSTTTNVNIIAEGRLLDEIQIKALERGHAPRMERKLKRNRGTKVGFDRGRFNQFSS